MRWTLKRYMQYVAKRDGLPVKKAKCARSWSEPEKRYFVGVLHCYGQYEGETIRITPETAEKHVYTPDFVNEINGVKVYHEVKGSYRLQSQDAARIRFVMASVARPNALFVWAKERKDRSWTIEEFWGGERVGKHDGVRTISVVEGMIVWQE